MALDRTREDHGIQGQQDELMIFDSDLLCPVSGITEKEQCMRAQVVKYENYVSEVLNDVNEDSDQKAAKAGMHDHILSEKEEVGNVEKFVSQSSLSTGEENEKKHDILHPQDLINGSDTKLSQGVGQKNEQQGYLSQEGNQERIFADQILTRVKNAVNQNATTKTDEISLDEDLSNNHEKEGKYFYYGSPLNEETGIWIPVSVPPMSESEHQEWTKGFCSNGGYLPPGETGWGQCLGEENELTMWDVVVEMLLTAKGRVNALASGEIPDISWMSGNLVEQAWKEMAQTLKESNFSTVQEIVQTEPPKWLPDSSASACMLCSVKFHPIMCTRHHCRFCGGIFCNDCTRGRSLLPEKFRSADPQRVCDVCCVRLESIQPYLMDQVSHAAQLPTHDLTDLSTLRSWVNFPWGQSMEYEIYKATNTIQSYSKVGLLKPEKRIPEAILRDAKGLAILTIVKVGMMVTYNIGTGLVISRRDDGFWSPPSAISSFGVGWGAQVGGELADFIIVLRTDDAVRTFTDDAQLSIGAGLSAAVGIVGRTAEASLRACSRGYAACYTYSCCKGAFIGCSLEGSIVTTRSKENSRFYGSQSITASDILLGSLPRPPAASMLYRALGSMYDKL
ncbi:hypothetical protein Leryth_010984 [Lithospermum erythrorhizon]|nr:hypothetical protein Leryth_010984 [Lithospermum erythrorhizon]